MRNLNHLDNFRISSGKKFYRKPEKDRVISIKNFSNPRYLNDNSYFIKIYFEGYLVIKEFFYTFEFSMDLITDNQTDVQADFPDDLERILKILESDFYSDDSRLINKMVNSIINFYSDELEFMML